jgi:hypothetical protein
MICSTAECGRAASFAAIVENVFLLLCQRCAHHSAVKRYRMVKLEKP